MPSSSRGIASAIASRISWSRALRRSGLEIRSRATASAGRSSRTFPEASSSIIAWRAPRSPISLQDYEDVAFADRIALRAADLLHGPVVFRLDRDLHLHRLEDDDRVAVRHLVADRDLDFPDVAGDVRLDVRHGGGEYPRVTAERGRPEAGSESAGEPAVIIA